VTEPRGALVIDDAKGALGPMALRLIRLGIDCFYAKDLDEGWLLAQQETPRIRVLVVTPDVDARELAQVLERLRGHGPALPRSAVVIGSCPDDATRERLSAAGVGWALWEPFDESALRMILSNAMAPPVVDHPRRHPRLPTTLLGRAFRGLHRKDGVVCSLSLEGAFLEMPHPYEEGTLLTLEIDIEGESFVTKAEVRYTRERGGSDCSEYPAGMGVAFREMEPVERERLTRYLAEQTRRFGL
jgi:hypothetical protein